ncbi:MAG: tetratricopeptide repeat protein [Candidatus Omnitrophica bacterium]|nr:tetratricopeptide repeat protein [Candidatus Omnitrophota bacterium]
MNFKKGLFLCAVIFFLTCCLIFSQDEKINPRSLTHYILAVTYDNLNQLDRAIQEYKKALSLDYNNSIIHLGLGCSYIKMDKIPQAIKELNLAVKFNPEAVEPHAILALVYLAEGKPELATQEYEIALKNASLLQPKNIEIYKNLGAVYLRQKKFKEAQDIYRLILELTPQDAQIHLYMAVIYDELKDKDNVEKELKKAIELNPDYHEAMNYLGYLYVEENKNLEEAEIMIKKALELDPSNGAYIDSLGWLYFKQGRLEEALEELEKASSLLEDPVIYDHLGEVYFKLGFLDKAKQAWQRSLELKPDQETVRLKLEKIK